MTVRWQRQLCRGKNVREIVPGAGEARGLGDAWAAGRFAQAVEAVAQVAHEAVPVAYHLRAAEPLEPTHTPRAPFEVLVVALDPLLLHFARDVLRLRHDGP